MLADFSILANPYGEVHQLLTETALKKSELQFHGVTFAPKKIKSIVAENVLTDKFQDEPSYHCDSEDLAGCSARLRRTRGHLIAALSGATISEPVL